MKKFSASLMTFTCVVVVGAAIPLPAADAVENESALSTIRTIAPEVLVDVEPSGTPSAKETSDTFGAEFGGSVNSPRSAADGLTVRPSNGAPITVSLPTSDAGAAALFEAPGITTFDNLDGTSTTTIEKAGGSAQIVTVIRGADSPTRFDYEFGSDTTVSLNLEYGMVSVSAADGTVIGYVAPAWAKDATGATVSTHYEVAGNSLTQVVDHASATYPVVADPWLGVDLIDHFWWSGSGSDRAIHVAVTPMMGAVSEGVASVPGWDELKTKAGSEVDQATYHQQWVCHAYGKVAIFFDPGNWDLEYSRGTTSDPIAAVNSHCNW